MDNIWGTYSLLRAAPLDSLIFSKKIILIFHPKFYLSLINLGFVAIDIKKYKKKGTSYQIEMANRPFRPPGPHVRPRKRHDSTSGPPMGHIESRFLDHGSCLGTTLWYVCMDRARPCVEDFMLVTAWSD